MSEQPIDIDDHINEAIREIIHDETAAWSVTTLRENGHMTNTWYVPGYVGPYPASVCLIGNQIRSYADQTDSNMVDIATAAIKAAELMADTTVEYTEERNPDE